MKARKVEHIGIAVRSIEESLPLWRDVLGLHHEGTETVAGMKVKVARLRAGETVIELIEPLEGEEPTRKFLEKRGEGIHHICLEVEDLAGAGRDLAARGITPLYPAPRAGSGGSLVNFLLPKQTHGVLVELNELPPEPMGPERS